MTCPKLKIPWPRWAIGDKPNAEQEHENYLALERWADGILKCIPSGVGSDVAAILYSENQYWSDVTDIAEYPSPDYVISAQTGGFSATGSIITVPEPGLYVWRQHFYWWNYASVTGGTDGVCYGGWYSEVSGDYPYTISQSYVPFFKSGSSPSAFRYHTAAGIVGTSADVEVLGGPQPDNTTVLTGDATWDTYFTLAKVSSLTVPPPN